MNSAAQKLFSTKIQFGLLAFAPLFLIVPTYHFAATIGFIVSIQLLVLASVFYFLRNLIPLKQKIPIILVAAISMSLISRMVFDAEAYFIASTIGLFFPLLVMNSSILSLIDDVFSRQCYKEVICHVSVFASVLILFFLLYGVLRSSLDDFSITNSPAACFLIMGFMFAVLNIIKSKFSEGSIE